MTNGPEGRAGVMRYTLLAHRVPGPRLGVHGPPRALGSQPACMSNPAASRDRRTCVGTVHVPPERRRALAGALLLAMLVLGVVAAPGAWPRWPAGLCAWAAFSLLLPELPRHQRGLCALIGPASV